MEFIRIYTDTDSHTAGSISRVFLTPPQFFLYLSYKTFPKGRDGGQIRKVTGSLFDSMKIYEPCDGGGNSGAHRRAD